MKRLELTPMQFKAGYMIVFPATFAREPIAMPYRKLYDLPNGNVVVREPELELGIGAEVARVETW